MKKTVIFLIFADIKRDNFKYICQFLIKLVTIILGLLDSKCTHKERYSDDKFRFDSNFGH